MKHDDVGGGRGKPVRGLVSRVRGPIHSVTKRLQPEDTDTAAIRELTGDLGKTNSGYLCHKHRGISNVCHVWCIVCLAVVGAISDISRTSQDTSWPPEQKEEEKCRLSLQTQVCLFQTSNQAVPYIPEPLESAEPLASPGGRGRGQLS